MGFYQRRYSEKFGTRTQNAEQNRTEQNNKRTEDDKTENVLNNFDQSEVASGSTNEKKTTISKFSEKLRQKMKRSKSRDTLSSSNRFTFEKYTYDHPRLWSGIKLIPTGLKPVSDQTLHETVLRPKPLPLQKPGPVNDSISKSQTGPRPKPVPNSN